MEIQEVHLTDKTPKNSRWEKAIFLLLLPLSIAAGGWAVQTITTKEVLKKDYVALSISILNTDKKIDPKLKEWAVGIVNDYAPRPLPESVKEDLKSGKETLLGREAGKVFNNGVLIVKDGTGGSVVIKLTNIKGCKANYSWKHFTADATEESGMGQLFEKYVKDEKTGTNRNEGTTTFRAGPIELEWSCGSEEFGWIYPSGHEMKFIFDAKLSDFKL